jgi:hypothetical protein
VEVATVEPHFGGVFWVGDDVGDFERGELADLDAAGQGCGDEGVEELPVGLELPLVTLVGLRGRERGDVGRVVQERLDDGVDVLLGSGLLLRGDGGALPPHIGHVECHGAADEGVRHGHHTGPAHHVLHGGAVERGAGGLPELGPPVVVHGERALGVGQRLLHRLQHVLQRRELGGRDDGDLFGVGVGGGGHRRPFLG